MSFPKIPLVVIVGPTAVGKTEISIRLAEQLGGEIVSADSRLFYRGMDIGTAKPTGAERRRVPHHLIDIADPDEVWSLAMFQKAAKEAVEAIHSRGRLPFLVGGTGQYIQAVISGWTPPPVKPDLRLRGVMEDLARQYNPMWLHDKLTVLDPVSAAKIDPRNLRRTIRAMEVIFSTGRPFSSQRKVSDSPYQLILIGLRRPRLEIYERVDARVEGMFANGFLDEVRSLLDRGYSPDLPSLSAIGYRECIAILQGRMTIDEAKLQIKHMTHAFVRRQSNWFKESDPKIKWFDVDDQTLASVTRYLTGQILLPGSN